MCAICSAEALLDPQVQANFDLIIIDAAPRLTTSHLQAMCASTHLLIPTVLQPIGVVCTPLPNNNRNLSGPLNVLRERIAAARLNPDILPEACFIRQRPPYRDCAGEKIAYAATANNEDYRDLRDEVDRLGDVLPPWLGAIARGWARKVKA